MGAKNISLTFHSKFIIKQVPLQNSKWVNRSINIIGNKYQDDLEDQPATVKVDLAKNEKKNFLNVSDH